MFFTLVAALALVSGVMLGLRYKAYVLFPISWAAIAMVIVASVMLGLTFWQSVLVIVSCLTLLQSSYLVGANFSNLPSKTVEGDARRLGAASRMTGKI
jgi:hypothetical protein